MLCLVSWQSVAPDPGCHVDIAAAQDHDLATSHAGQPLEFDHGPKLGTVTMFSGTRGMITHYPPAKAASSRFASENMVTVPSCQFRENNKEMASLFAVFVSELFLAVVFDSAVFVLFAPTGVRRDA